MIYYDFTIDSKPVGYFEIHEEPGCIYMSAILCIDGHRQENAFWIRHKRGKPTEVKAGSGAWQPVPDGTYPTSAYPLVLRAGHTQYMAYNEGSRIVEQRHLQTDGHFISEYAEGRLVRKFRLEGTEVDYIFWGGTAESRLASSKAEAVHGTVFADAAEPGDHRWPANSASDPVPQS